MQCDYRLVQRHLVRCTRCGHTASQYADRECSIDANPTSMATSWGAGRIVTHQRTATSRVLHVWNDYEPADAEVRRRTSLAQSSWPALGWIPCPVTNPMLPRTSRRSTQPIDDPRDVPFIRDLFAAGYRQANSGDYVVFTNANVGIWPDATERLIATLDKYGCAYSQRLSAPARFGLPPIRRTPGSITTRAPTCSRSRRSGGSTLAAYSPIGY